MASRNEVSAGGVVYRVAKGIENATGSVELLVCKDAGYHRWVLPKGWVNQKETLEQAALREVREEVGIQARIVEPLGEPEQYIYTSRGVRVFKTVHYFLMVYEAGSETEHDAEMEEVRWVSPDEALTLLAYQGARNVMARAWDRIQSLVGGQAGQGSK